MPIFPRILIQEIYIWNSLVVMSFRWNTLVIYCEIHCLAFTWQSIYRWRAIISELCVLQEMSIYLAWSVLGSRAGEGRGAGMRAGYADEWCRKPRGQVLSDGCLPSSKQKQPPCHAIAVWAMPRPAMQGKQQWAAPAQTLFMITPPHYNTPSKP